MTDPFEHAQQFTREELVATLKDMTERIEQDDSMEGHIFYRWSETPGVYDVAGVYRVGNSRGQGGIRFLSEIPT